MRKIFLLASLVLLIALVAKSEAQQQYNYQAVTRNITTAAQYCSSSTKCNIIGSGAAYHQLTWNVVGTLSACSVRVDSSSDGITWNSGDVLGAQTCTSNGQAISTSHVVNYVRVNVTSITPVSTATLTVQLTGFQNLPSGGGTITSIATSSPISGGPITTTGTISCPTCGTVTSIATTSPIGGGTITTTGTITCTTCTTNAASGLVSGNQLPPGIYDQGMPNPKTITAWTSSTATNNVVEAYTVPTGRRCVVFGIQVNNYQTNNLPIRAVFGTSSGGPYYLISGTISISATQMQPTLLWFNNAFVLEAGEVLGFQVVSAAGTGNWYGWFDALEFDNTGYLKSVRQFNPTGATESTMYTVPASKSAHAASIIYPYLLHTLFTDNVGTISNNSGSTRSAEWFYQPSGASRKTLKTITNLSLTTNVVTVNATNDFSAGDGIFIDGITDASWTFLNRTINTVVSATGSSFTFNRTHANVGSTVISAGYVADGKFFTGVGNSVTTGVALGLAGDIFSGVLQTGDKVISIIDVTPASNYVHWFNIWEVPTP